MNAHAAAVDLYLANGADPAAADVMAREMVSFLRLLVREALRQERQEREEKEEGGECLKHSPAHR